MKRATKKTPSKASQKKKSAKDLEVKPAKGGTVRGGDISIPYGKFQSDYGRN